MKKNFIYTVLCATLSLSLEAQVKVTRAQNSNLTKDYYVFIENVNDQSMKNQVVQSLKTNTSIKVFVSEKDQSAPIIITQSRKGLVKDNAGRDCLIGVGACSLGLLFVQATGETVDTNNTATGLYATVGDKYVEGGAAVFTSFVWLGGCIFGIKGIIELFKPQTQEKNVTAALNGSTALTAEGIIRNAFLVKNNEKEFTSGENNVSDIVMYVNSQLY